MSALDEAYSQSNPGSVIYAVKQAIINQIHEVDDRVVIRSTEYFNHTFAPDLVLTWNGGAIERQLFVRQDESSGELAEDVRQIGSSRPIIFNLDPVPPGRHAPKDSDITLQRADTLLTDAAGMSEVGSRKRSSRVVKLAAPSLLQGGRGVFDERIAFEVSSGLARGFLGAENLRTEETRTAVLLIERVFSRIFAARLTDFLRAVWVGAGGMLSDFPSASSTSGGLTDEALRFLLDFEQNSTLEYWRRVGGNLTVERLLAISPASSDNLDRLITANLDRIVGKSCGVQSIVAAGSADDANSSWRVDDRSVIWDGRQARVRFAMNRDLATEDLRGRASGIPLADLLERAQGNGVPLESLQMTATTTARQINYGSTLKSSAQNIAADPQLEAMSASLGDSMLVQRATAALPGPRSLICDYQSKTAAGRTGAKFALADFFAFAVPLLAALDAEDSSSILELRRQNSEVANPPGLFPI
ncbi:hypothetical protein [Actinokineospora cianjurensis]|uniref:hypothetical protein n=1 Tax=Actinokineospora cianjurensis TaxID=585224 RepID=UPI0011C3694E|nr:hypothetical protein [Actinokineospora cianjurensis]